MDITFWKVFFLLGASANGCFIMMRGAETIECSSMNELTFQVTRKMDNKTLRIAECHPDAKLCVLTDKTLESNYVIANTSHGGLLVVRNVNDDTYGEYACFETYTPRKRNVTIIDASTIPPNCVPTGTHEQAPRGTKPIVLKKLKAMKKDGYLPIECSSDTHITFQFIAEKTNQTINIARCQTTENACILENRTVKDNFLITRTSTGGLLTVINLNEDVSGAYRCCETHNLSNCDMIHIQSQNIESAPKTPLDSTTKEVNPVQRIEHIYDTDLTNVLGMCLVIVSLYVFALALGIYGSMILKVYELCSGKQSSNEYSAAGQSSEGNSNS